MWFFVLTLSILQLCPTSSFLCNLQKVYRSNIFVQFYGIFGVSFLCAFNRLVAPPLLPRTSLHFFIISVTFSWLFPHGTQTTNLSKRVLTTFSEVQNFHKNPSPKYIYEVTPSSKKLEITNIHWWLTLSTQCGIKFCPCLKYKPTVKFAYKY